MAVHEAPGRAPADVDAHCRAELASCDLLRLRGCLLRKDSTAAQIFAIGALVADIASPSPGTSSRRGTVGTGIQSPAGTAGPTPLGAYWRAQGFRRAKNREFQ